MVLVDNIVFENLEEDPLCDISINKKSYRVSILPEIKSKKKELRDCDAKTLADELNSLYGDRHPSEVIRPILNDENFIKTLESLQSYLMKDGSKLVWIDEFYTWGFIFPKDFLFFSKSL